ncbi:hypothetical protein D7B24_004661 [Verticillium nonalfalfae]|nr:uncharacterized protein D7B24_004661 [Verticillium nonalfalfae]RNJ52013.1 hypothetical protein D7B24_004661 [Verticillium nonalfalfae]
MPLSSDDCLFINIWTPYLPSTGTKSLSKVALKPVLVYLYGGAFQFGSGKDPNFDLTNIASRGDVVAITINYRLGNAGMLVFKDGIHRGNYPINDQISGLKWVSENIAAFGGDPNKVTILGESAGAMSVRYLMASPEAKGLFHGVMLQSDGNEGIAAAAGRFWSIEQSYEYFTKNVLELVGCADAEDELTCLREVPGVILSGLPENRSIANVAVIDGKYLTTPFLPVDGSGFAQDIPVLGGVVRDEIAIFDILQNQIYWPAVTFEIWVGFLCLYQDFLRVSPASILNSLPLWNLTPQSNYTQLFNATSKILTDNVYVCTEQARAYSGVKNGAFKRVYAFNAYRTYSAPTITAPYCNAPVTADHPFGDPSLEYYKCHASTQTTMFGNYARMGMPERDEFDLPFSQLMVDYWASFVRSGDPNPDHAWLAARGFASTLAEVKRVGVWSEVDASSPEWMILEWGGHMAPFGKEAECKALGQPLTYWEDPAPGPNPPSDICSFLGGDQ